MSTHEMSLLIASVSMGFIWAFIVMQKPSSEAGTYIVHHNKKSLTLIAWWKNLPFMQAIRKRAELTAMRKDCLTNLPAFLDILNLGLSAGMSFDTSLNLYCSKFNTNLALCLRRSLLSWQIGEQSRSEALRLLARELDLAPFSRFVTAVDEALRFGSPLAHTLSAQAELIREEQRSTLEEQVEKVPIKMLIPLGTLIVPAMLLAILGPLLSAASGIF
ncbi:type II secretion system F family protein [Atopobium fossor]|uniref:type II secretion system F family protein n=1 Tax=Atopobium fossor TaxID=39487 RepID=UPI0003F5D372|nr:type II secretion system F family protein [Atopobium fossor]